jgi:CheY-like chemotaxis protein
VTIYCQRGILALRSPFRISPSSLTGQHPAVDDSAIYRKLVEQSLSGERYAVLFAKNGREALDLFAKHQPAVVITDWNMPDMGGLELRKHIRCDFPDCYCHLILSSCLRATARKSKQ